MDEEIIPAKLILHGAGEWSEEGRKTIADWLRRCADSLEEDGSKYAVRFRATYRYLQEIVDG
jgi:hypothetical protein